jgi:hypothetical protein
MCIYSFNIFDRYNKGLPEDHLDAMYYPLELKNITLVGSKNIDTIEIIARLKARLHGRQRTLLRIKLTERCNTMQQNMEVNKLKKVIEMIIPKAR